MRVKTFGDLFRNTTARTAEIRCLYSGQTVRRLTRGQGWTVVDAMSGPVLIVPDSTPIAYEPWLMDRGSLLFRHGSMEGQNLKLCGEGDSIVFGDGTEETIDPAHNAEQVPHAAQFNMF